MSVFCSLTSIDGRLAADVLFLLIHSLSLDHSCLGANTSYFYLSLYLLFIIYLLSFRSYRPYSLLYFLESKLTKDVLLIFRASMGS